jgi:hypothetical protein
MRFLLIALLLWPMAVHAADDPLMGDVRAAQNSASNDADEDAAKDDGKDSSEAESVEKTDGKDDSAEKAPAKPKVDWVRVESTGTISSAKQGALEKTIWRKQKRSEIEENLQKLPSQFNLRSAFSLQRRLLLSKTDTSLMIDDIGPLRGKDMLIQRINKLMEMGLYDDAWVLYTQHAENPYDVSIAQLGMLLLVMKNDLATACLEEKVFSAKYPQDRFFDVLDRACAQTLGAEKPPAFSDDPILHSVYNDDSFAISAANPQALTRMTALQRALVLANGKIRYDGLTAQVATKTPSELLALYLMDKKLTDSARAMIKAESDRRGLTWYIASIARDPVWKKAADMKKDKEGQWPMIESALASHQDVADLYTYYGDMLAEAAPAQLSTVTLKKAMAVFLAGGRALPDYWLKAAQKQAPENPIIYIYLQLFRSLTPTVDATVSPQEFYNALKALKEADAGQIVAIVETLDKEAEILNDPLNVYEKHSGLTSEDNYVMPSGSSKDQANQKPEQKQLGITVLAVLNSLAGEPDNMYSEAVRKALESMLNVGLIEDAKLIGAETAASILNKY